MNDELIDISEFYRLNDKFDISFYKLHYDLANMTNNELINHYTTFGKKEKRLTSSQMFLDIYPKFNCNDYKKLNNLENLNLLDDQVYIHFWMTGRNKTTNLLNEIDNQIDNVIDCINYDELKNTLIKKNICVINFLFGNNLTDDLAKKILINQINKIKDCGLYDILDYIFIFKYQNIYLPIFELNKIKIILVKYNVTTLFCYAFIKYICDIINDNINFIYIDNQMFINNLLATEYLEYFLLENYLMCMTALQKYKCIGVNYQFKQIDQTNKVGLFFRNSWWSKSMHIIKLNINQNDYNEQNINYWIIGNLYENDNRNILSLNNFELVDENIIMPKIYRFDIIKQNILFNLKNNFFIKRPIYGVYYICCLNNYYEIVQDQLLRLVNSCLYDNSYKIICFVCNQSNECLKLLKQYEKIQIIATDENLYEKFAINNYKKYIDHNQYYLYYIHTKGITRTEQCFTDWRNLCNYITINKWKLSIELLYYYDCVGINLKNFPKKHFSGNFWWSKSEHLNKLNDINDGYLSPEMYILSYYRTNYVSLFESNVIHCMIPYNISNYINKLDDDFINNILIIPEYNTYDKKSIKFCGEQNLLIELPII